MNYTSWQVASHLSRPSNTTLYATSSWRLKSSPATSHCLMTQGYPRTISSSPRSMIKKCISCLLSPTRTSKFTHSQIVPALLWVLLIFQMVLGVLSWSFPILSLFRSLLLMKLSVAPESMRTCLLVVECKDFKRVGIHSDLYLLVKTIFDSTFSRHAQTNGVASFKNLLLNQPPYQSELLWPYWWWRSFLLQ